MIFVVRVKQSSIPDMIFINIQLLGGCDVTIHSDIINHQIRRKLRTRGIFHLNDGGVEGGSATVDFPYILIYFVFIYGALSSFSSRLILAVVHIFEDKFCF